jgi:hypothetical protein
MNNMHIERCHSGKSSFSRKTNFTRIAVLRKVEYIPVAATAALAAGATTTVSTAGRHFLQIKGLENISLGIEFTHSWTSFQV